MLTFHWSIVSNTDFSLEDGGVFALGRQEYGRLGLGEGGEDATLPTKVTSQSGQGRNILIFVYLKGLQSGEVYRGGLWYSSVLRHH